nr:helix-turn-helix transcriptional regulator [Pseudodesulfovibrio alkaliphilus]
MVELHFWGPASKADAAVKVLNSLGYTESSLLQTVSAASQAPGRLLVAARYGQSLTQRELSENSGIPRRHISEMENGKRPIGKENAKRLANSLDTDYRFFL